MLILNKHGFHKRFNSYLRFFTAQTPGSSSALQKPFLILSDDKQWSAKNSFWAYDFNT